MRTRSTLFVLVTIAVFSAERRGYCDDVVKDIPPGDDKIVAVKEGDKAPFTGQLFEPATALRWANWLQQYKLRLDVDVTSEKKICAADKDLEQRKLAIEVEKNTVITTDLRRQLTTSEGRVTELQKAVDSPPFYRTVWFGALLGAVATGALVGLGVYAASVAH